MARYSNTVKLSLMNKLILQVVMVLIAGLLFGRNDLVTVAASATANESSPGLIGMPPAGATSEDYMLGSTISSSNSFTWPTQSGKTVGRDSEQFRISNRGQALRFGEPSEEIEREAVWAKADVAESVVRLEFEKEFFKSHSLVSTVRESGRDSLARVGYVSTLHLYPRNTEYPNLLQSWMW